MCKGTAGIARPLTWVRKQATLTSARRKMPFSSQGRKQQQQNGVRQNPQPLVFSLRGPPAGNFQNCTIQILFFILKALKMYFFEKHFLKKKKKKAIFKVRFCPIHSEARTT